MKTPKEYRLHPKDFAKLKSVLDGEIFWLQVADHIVVRPAVPNKPIRKLLRRLHNPI